MPLMAWLLIGTALASGFAGWEVRDWKAGSDAKRASDAALVFLEKRLEEAHALGLAEGNITISAGEKFAKQETKIVNRVVTQIKEVLVYVPQKTACTVPLGFVKLHNAGAEDRDLAAPELALPTGTANATGTAVSLADVAATLRENYGRCTANARQLDALNAWYRDQQQLHNAGAK